MFNSMLNRLESEQAIRFKLKQLVWWNLRELVCFKCKHTFFQVKQLQFIVKQFTSKSTHMSSPELILAHWFRSFLCRELTELPNLFVVSLLVVISSTRLIGTLASTSSCIVMVASAVMQAWPRLGARRLSMSAGTTWGLRLPADTT
jgi:hypothetical protein